MTVKERMEQGYDVIAAVLDNSQISARRRNIILHEYAVACYQWAEADSYAKVLESCLRDKAPAEFEKLTSLCMRKALSNIDVPAPVKRGNPQKDSPAGGPQSLKGDE